MLDQLPTFFDHRRHKLHVHGVAARLDVLVFQGEESLSQPFTYRVEFTSTERDLAADSLLGQDASFSLHAAPQAVPFWDLSKPETNDTSVGSSTRDVSLPKGKNRSLTAGEIAMAGTVFKDAIDYTKVKVYHRGWWGFLEFQNTASTLNGHMYYPESTGYYRDDFSATEDDRDKALFIHEMTHVWQFQLEYPVIRAGLKVTRQGAKAYRYELTESGRICDYNMEQQGEIVSDYYMICVLRKPSMVWNPANINNSPDLLASTLEGLLINPPAKIIFRTIGRLVK